MLLCDHAQVADGKLYVLGGGWNQAQAGVPLPMALAVVIAVPWDATNQKHELIIRLADDDGVQIDNEDQPVVIGGPFEVGRPPGVKQGTPLNQQMAFKFGTIVLDPGGYVFELSIDDTMLARAPFRVIEN